MQARLPEIAHLQNQLDIERTRAAELDAKGQQDAENAAFAQAELEAAKQELQQQAAALESELSAGNSKLAEVEAVKASLQQELAEQSEYVQQIESESLGGFLLLCIAALWTCFVEAGSVAAQFFTARVLACNALTCAILSHAAACVACPASLPCDHTTSILHKMYKCTISWLGAAAAVTPAAVMHPFTASTLELQLTV